MNAIRPGTAFGALVLFGAGTALVVDAARSLPAAPASATATTGDLTAVRVAELAFPVEIVVVAGGAVRWHNADRVRHTVTAADGAFHLDLPAGGSAESGFPTVGTFTYLCEIHPRMRGRVVAVGRPPATEDRGGYR